MRQNSSQFIEDIESVTLSTINEIAYRYWLDSCGKDAIPRADALDPLKIPRQILVYFTVIEVIHPGPRFMVRLTGSKIRDAAGQDYTGQMVDQMPGAEEVAERFSWCVRNRRPYCSRARLLWSENEIRRYEALVLPFGEPDRAIEKLASIIYFYSDPEPSDHS